MNQSAKHHSGHRKSLTLLVNSLAGGGAERVCVTLANALNERGWAITVVAMNLDNAVLRSDLSLGIVVTSLDKRHTRDCVVALARYFLKEKPTRVLVFNERFAVMLALLRKVLRQNFRLVARNVNYLSVLYGSQTSFWHKHVVAGITRSLYGNVDHVVAQSSDMAEDLVCNFRLKPDLVSVIHNPVSPAVFEECAASNLKKENYLLCVGRLEKQKAFHFAIEAFSRIAKEDQTLRLKIIGDGSRREPLQELAGKLSVSDRVDFEGFQKNIAPYYRHACATLLTSLYEGFPNVLAESIACGTPVISFDCKSGPRDIIIEGVNGFLIPMQDVKRFSEAIVEALSMQWSQEHIMETAQRFQKESIIDDYETIICP